jgi:hypothetical protein
LTGIVSKAVSTLLASPDAMSENSSADRIQRAPLAAWVALLR